MKKNGIINKAVNQVLSEMIDEARPLFDSDFIYEKVRKMRVSIDNMARSVKKEYNVSDEDDIDNLSSPARELLEGFSWAASGLEEVLQTLK